MSRRSIWWLLAGVLAATAALPAPVARAQKEPLPGRIQILHSATARLVLTEGRSQAWFTEARLAYGDLLLQGGAVEYDSAADMVALTGEVKLIAPDYSLATQTCTVWLEEGRATAEGGVQLALAAEDITANAESGELRFNPQTLTPTMAALHGNAAACWAKGMTLQAPSMQFDLASGLYSADGGFASILRARLLSDSLAGAVGEELRLTGASLFAQAEPGTEPRRVSLTAWQVAVESERALLKGANLAASVTLEPDMEAAVAGGMLALSGSAGEPVSGWFLDEQGRRAEFTAASLLKPGGVEELRLTGEVHIFSAELTLCADRVLAAPVAGGIHVTIPARFRVVISPAVFAAPAEGEAAAADAG